MNTFYLPATKFFSCVMAFLRSVTRYNSIVSRNIPSTACTVSHSFSSTSSTRRSNGSHGKALTSELLSSNNPNYARRDLSTNPSSPVSSTESKFGRNNVNNSSQMSTVAATPAAKVRPMAAAATSNDQSSPPHRDPLDTGFNDPIAAFKSKTTWELIRAYVVYLMCSSEYLVENNMKVKKKMCLCCDFRHLPGCNFFFFIRFSYFMLID